jgi:two-component system cell cycle response regulator
MSRLAEEIARSDREGTPLVCLMIDVDHFKPINDTYGHLSGDAALRQLARCIDDEVRRTDVSARYGGEEFVILLPRTEVDAGAALAERVRRAVAAEPFSIEGADAPVAMTVSIGIAEHVPRVRDEDVKNSGERLIAAADLALYDAKASGRNRVVRGDRGSRDAPWRARR